MLARHEAILRLILGQIWPFTMIRGTIWNIIIYVQFEGQLTPINDQMSTDFLTK